MGSPVTTRAGLVGLLVLVCLGAAHAETKLSVTVSGSQVVVDALDVRLSDLLRELGRRAGFEVVQIGPVETKVTIAVHAATFDDALKQILRNVNHAVRYDGGDGGSDITKVLLLGPVSARASTVDGPWPAPPFPAMQAQGPRQAPGRMARSISASLPAVESADAAMSSGPVTDVTTSETPESIVGDGATSVMVLSAEPGVDRLLWAHASHVDPILSTVPAPNGSRVANEPPPYPPPSVQDALAITTRAAQQNLSALIGGLARATESLVGGVRR